MDDLVKRLEAATGAERELDALISLAVDDWAAREPALAPYYTRSLDYALTLVDLSHVTLSLSLGAVNLAFVTVLSDDALSEPPCFEGTGATPALALCIAALRALQDRKP